MGGRPRTRSISSCPRCPAMASRRRPRRRAGGPSASRAGGGGGYTRYVAQGGDQGANVTDALGRLAPTGLLGVHLNLLGAFPPAVLAGIFGGSIPAPEGLLKRLAVAVVSAGVNKEPLAFNQV